MDIHQATEWKLTLGYAALMRDWFGTVYAGRPWSLLLLRGVSRRAPRSQRQRIHRGHRVVQEVGHDFFSVSLILGVPTDDDDYCYNGDYYYYYFYNDNDK